MTLSPSLGPLIGVVLAALLFVSARDYDELAREGQLGPGFWPRLTLVGLSLACLAKIIDDWRAARWQRAAIRDRPELAPAKLIASIALIVLYVLLTPPIGFPLATGAFVAAFMWLAGARAPLSIGANAGLGTLVLLYAFVKFVYLPLPKGVGPFETMTLALYRALGVF